MENQTNEKNETAREKTTGRFQGLQLIIVQSSVCLLTVLIVLILKAVGGDAYKEISSLFHTAMIENNVLESVLPSVEAKETATVASPVTTTTVAEAVSASTNKTFYSPLTGGVLTSAFGEREDPFAAGVSDTHYGIDIAAGEGTALAALTQGVVQEVGYEETGYGYYILVSCDDGHQYLYAHCSQILASEGDNLVGGETIALVGSTGRSTGNHVHIEWREDGVAVDPLAVLPTGTYV